MLACCSDRKCQAPLRSGSSIAVDSQSTCLSLHLERECRVLCAWFTCSRGFKTSGSASPTSNVRNVRAQTSIELTFQCAVEGGPVTSLSSSSRPSLAALLKPLLSFSKSLSSGLPRIGTAPTTSNAATPDLPLSKLLSLLAGGVSGARGRLGILVGDAAISVGRSAAGMYKGCFGCRSWRTWRCE